MLLDETYYNPFKEWMEVGWALHNTDPNNLFWTWIKFSSKSPEFEWNNIPEFFKKWNEMKNDGFTFRSIHYWAKNLDKQKYISVINKSIEILVYKTLPGGGCDTDIAILAKNLFMGEFACVSLKEKNGFSIMVIDGKLVIVVGLRIKLSQEVEALFWQYAKEEKIKAQMKNIPLEKEKLSYKKLPYLIQSLED